MVAVTTLATPLLQWKTFLTAAGLTDEVKEQRAKLMHGMLCLQLREEKASAKLVSSITPICRRDLIEQVLKGQGIAEIITQAQLEIAKTIDPTVSSAPICPQVDLIIPADLETALNWIADDVDGIKVEIVDDD
jgi:hypothetical protein